MINKRLFTKKKRLFTDFLVTKTRDGKCLIQKCLLCKSDSPKLISITMWDSLTQRAHLQTQHPMQDGRHIEEACSTQYSGSKTTRWRATVLSEIVLWLPYMHMYVHVMYVPSTRSQILQEEKSDKCTYYLKKIFNKLLKYNGKIYIFHSLKTKDTQKLTSFYNT